MFNSVISDKSDPLHPKIISQIAFPPMIAMGIKGGGIAVTGIVGLLRAFEKFNLLKELHHIAGTSAGAITALVLALGYSAQEMYDKLYNLPIMEFLEGADYATQKGYLANARKIYQIYSSETHSLSSGNKFLKWLEDLIEGKFPEKKKLKFGELAKLVDEDIKNNHQKNLRYPTMVATNLSLSRPEAKILDAENAANIEIARGARASGSFPTVFEHVQLDRQSNDLYTDGGVKINLLTDIFDKKKLLNDYPPTENLTNPCCLFVMVASRKDYLQILHGVNKRVNNKTLKESVTSLATAISDNVPIKQLREKRLFIVIPNGDRESSIDTLEFAITDKGKIKLIDGAEKVALEFLENYAGAAYEVKAYNSIIEWLDDQESLQTLANLIADYRAYQAVNPNEQLQQYIRFLDQYVLYRTEEEQIKYTEKKLSYRFKNATKEVLKHQIDLLHKNRKYLKPSPPKEHVDLPYIYPEDSWHAMVIADMKERLAVIVKKIIDAEDKLAHLKKELITLLMADKRRKYREIQHKLFGYNISYDFNTPDILNFNAPDILKIANIHHLYYDLVKQYAEQKEYVNVLRESKHDLDIKLNNNKKKQYKPHPAFQQFSSLIDAWQEQEFPDDNMLPDSAFKTILYYVDIYSPIINIPSDFYHPTKEMFYQLNLLKPMDLKLFCLASLYFLQLKMPKSSRLRELECHFYKIFEYVIPDNYSNLSIFLHKEGLDFQCAAIKLEKILQYFDLIYQKAASIKSIGEEATSKINFSSDINLDRILQDFTLREDEKQTAISLKNVYTYVRSLGLFGDINSSETIDNRESTLKQNEDCPAWFFKSFRSLD